MDQQSQSTQQGQINPSRLFVGNLPYSTTGDTLTELFSQFGTVVESIVMADKFTGRSKGFGFVTMSTPDEAQASVDGLNEHELDGRKMLVNIARPKAPREDRQGGSGYGRRPPMSGGYRGGNDRSSGGRRSW